MRPLIAPLVSLITTAGASAVPFPLEPLVKQGQALPSLAGPVLLIGSPSINSDGEWAVPVGGPSPNDPVFRSGVLGNSGYRISPGTDPDGNASSKRPIYEGTSILEGGELAVVLRQIGAPSELWLGETLVSPSPGASFYEVHANSDGTLTATMNTGVASFTLLATQNGPGQWSTSIVHGRDVQTPVGTVVTAPFHRLGYDRDASGAQAWSGVFSVPGVRGDENVAGIVRGDEFVAQEGAASGIPGYEYGNGIGGVLFNSVGDFAFGMSLQAIGNGPAQFANGIFREDHTPLATSLDEVSGLQFDHWSVDVTAFSTDENNNILWIARASEAPEPGDPFGVYRAALLYNDIIVIQTGDILADGDIVLGVSTEVSLSNNGLWGIASLSVYDVHQDSVVNSVYRFSVPAPSTATYFAFVLLASSRRRR